MNDDDLPIGMMGQRPDIISRYRKMVASGESPRMAEMLAVRAAPVLNTATSLAADLKVKRIVEHAGLPHLLRAREQARKAGIPVTEDSFYNGSMADERQGADPEAWIHPGDGIDKYKRLVRNRGGGCESLGISHGESQERVDTVQPLLEKQRKANREKATIKQQVTKDGQAGRLSKEMTKNPALIHAALK